MLDEFATERLKKLKDDELDIYIGKVTREYISAKTLFDKVKVKYDDLNSFLEFNAEKELIKKEFENNGIEKLFELKNTHVNDRSSSMMSRAGITLPYVETKDEIIEAQDSISNHTLNDLNVHPDMLADKIEREEKSSKLCNTGEVGSIKRDISIRPYIKIPTVIKIT